jgi:hypothetical protein
LQKAIGLDAISASQLSRKNREVDPSIFARVFLELVQKIQCYKQQKKQKKTKGIPLKIIDSSTVPLSLTRYPWATFRKTKAGVKLHLLLVFMDADTVYPEKAVIITAHIHDHEQLEVLIDE